MFDTLLVVVVLREDLAAMLLESSHHDHKLKCVEHQPVVSPHKPNTE